MKNLDYNQEALSYLHQTQVKELVENRDSPEEFLNEEAWPVVEEFLSDIGVELQEDYTVRLTEQIIEGADEGTDFAGSAGYLADQANDERCIRLSPSTDMTLLPLLAHEGNHKYQDELKQPAREIASSHEVFRPIDGWLQYVDIGNGRDFQYSALAHKRPERLDNIGRLGDEEVAKWDRKTSEARSRLREEYQNRFGDTDIVFDNIVDRSGLSEREMERVDCNESVAQEIRQWFESNSEQYKRSAANRAEARRRADRAVNEEMRMAGIDQDVYENINYNEAFTMAVTLFAGSALNQEAWQEYLRSSHDYSEEPMKTMIWDIYDKATDAEGSDMEKMKHGLELQDQVYKEGEFIA